MRAFFIFIMLGLSPECFCQKKAEAPAVKLSKENISKANTLRELIGNVPADCTIRGYIAGLNIQGKYFEIGSDGDTLSPMMKKYMKNSATIFIEKIRSDCSGALKASYKIIVE